MALNWELPRPFRMVYTVPRAIPGTPLVALSQCNNDADRQPDGDL